MKQYIALGCFISMIIGIGLTLSALRYKSDEHPGLLSFNPRNWKPVWRMRSWFSPRGYWLNLIGISMIVLSSVLALVFLW